MPRKCKISAEQWDWAINLFELGHMNGRQIADDLGVSPQTLMREMRRREAVYGSRVEEAIAPLNACIDEKQRLEALRRAEADRKAIDRAAATTALLDEMMKAILAADQRGELASVGGLVEQVGAAFGVSPSRRPRLR
jgi:hypothetical protein